MDAVLHPSFSTWIMEVLNNPFVAYCKICQKSLNLSNMAKQAISSHAQSGKKKKFCISIVNEFEYVKRKLKRCCIKNKKGKNSKFRTN